MKEIHLDLLKKLIKSEIREIIPLHGGMMNEAYIIKCDNGSFVYYIPTEQANEMVDRTLEKQVQDLAENLSLTRKTIYFDEKTGIKLLEYIEGDSLNHVEKFDSKKVANLFYRLHSAKTKINVDYSPFEKLEGYKKDAAAFVNKLDPIFKECYSLILKNKDMLEKHEKVLCHNDGQRSNIVKDKNNNYWLIDYEFAMNNDPIYDIATFGNDNPNDGLEVLKDYVKLANLDESESFNTYCLWRMFVSLQWYLVALIKHYRGEGKIHNIDFLLVAQSFLENAAKTKQIYQR